MTFVSMAVWNRYGSDVGAIFILLDLNQRVSVKFLIHQFSVSELKL